MKSTNSDLAVAQERQLPSGRSVLIRAAEGQEELEIRNADGAVEVKICLTSDGPVVQVNGGRLEMKATETISLQCQKFEVDAPAGADLQTDGEVRITGQEVKVETEGDIWMNGQFIRLNCEPEEPKS